MRTPRLDVWETLPALVEKALQRVLDGTNAGFELEYTSGVPPVVNDADLIEITRSALHREFGADGVVEAEHSWGGDDFAWYAREIRAAFVRLGVHDPSSTSRLDLHVGRFDVDERSIAHGVRAIVADRRRPLRSSMTIDAWVFGYGSLVSPESIAATIGRPVDLDFGFAPAELYGFTRSWNYGSLRQRATWDGPHGRVEDGIVVSLGLVNDRHRSTNGAIVRVTADEFHELDRRESDYDRVDVTDRVETALTEGPGRGSDRGCTPTCRVARRSSGTSGPALSSVPPCVRDTSTSSSRRSVRWVRTCTPDTARPHRHPTFRSWLPNECGWSRCGLDDRTNVR